MIFQQGVVKRPSEGYEIFGGDISHGSDKRASTKLPLLASTLLSCIDSMLVFCTQSDTSYFHVFPSRIHAYII